MNERCTDELILDDNKYHAKDWFIVANNEKEAITFHEEMEGYDPGDATAEMIMEIPSEIITDIGWQSDEVLHSCGAIILVDGLARVVQIGDRKFCEGLLESTIRNFDNDKSEAHGKDHQNKEDKPTVY